MIRHHTIQSKWTDEGHRATISLPCEPWAQPAPPKEEKADTQAQFAANWTDDEIKKMVSLRGQGLKPREIAEKLGRTKSSIEGKLRRLT
jgi:DNA-directed RNA polymerase specialized sigma24 family protein